MVRPEKVEEVELLTTKLKDSHGVVLADFTGLSVELMTELRDKCREKNVEFRVVKNRLARRAAAEAETAVIDPLLRGPTGIAFGMDSAVEPAKVLVDFAKDNEALAIKGGFLDGKLLDASQVTDLSKIPGREELLAMVMRGVQAPISSFAGALNSTLQSLAGAMNALAEKKEKEG